ncbi:MAG: hypothetical protein MJ244_04400 [Clostridia bacterium]|nr:hypothetical protein [Clostridia bacterium]
MNPLGNIFGNSPLGLIGDAFKTGGNPRLIAESMLRKYGNNNPMLSELSKLASNNDKEGIEKLARKYFKEQNRDFDAEYSNFMSQFKG